MQTVKQMISSFTRQRKQRRRAYAAFTTLAILVSITTMYTLSQPAATLAAEPTCGLEEHIHTDDCYTQRLVCGLEEQPGDEAHVHDETCYVQRQELVCGQEEAEAHAHSEDCCGLTCGQEEYEAHAHGEDCYTTVTETCGQEEYPAHTHGDGCYTTTRSLTCGQAESSGHTHGDGCYDETGALICGQSESEGHTHSDSCYEESTSLTCTEREGEGHTHTDGCTTQRTELTCAAQEGPGHTHSDSCYGLTCGLEEAEGHAHTEDCYQTVDELACGKGHVHTDACYERGLICEKPEHTHSSLCYGEAEDVLLQEQGDMMIVLPEGAEVPEGYEAEYSYIAADNSFGVKVFAPEGALPEDAALVAELLEEESEAYTAAEAALQAMNEEQTEDENPGYDGFVALDIRFVDAGGDEVEPTAPVYVCINALGLLPEDADPTSVAVQHHAEITESALFGLRKTTETVVETVADSTEETGPVEVSENAEDVTQDVAAAFPVESFSTFTITWDYDPLGTVDLPILCIDATTGEGIGTDASITKGFGKTVNVSEEAPQFDGYTFDRAVIAGSEEEALTSQTKVVGIRCVAGTWQYNPTTTYYFSREWTDLNGQQIYFLYNADNQRDITIQHVDTAGDAVADQETTKIVADQWVEMFHYGKTIDGYVFDSAHVLTFDGEKISAVKYDSAESNWWYRLADGTEVSAGAAQPDIYLVYTLSSGLHTVTTVDSTSKGLHLVMFDYTNAANLANGGYGDGSTKEGLTSKTTSGSGSWYEKFPTATDTDGNSVNLSKWFGASGENRSEANHLFLQSVYESTGDFYYSSFENFAEFKNGNFAVYEELGTPSSNSNYFYQRGNFMPYNTLDPENVRNYNRYSDAGEALSTTDPRYDENLYGFNEGNNFYFGMYAYAEFYQPKDGKVTRPDGSKDDMIFEFTGDDDMWVYVDGVLVLDLGGIHDAQSGYINFTTGDVGWTDTKTGQSVTWKTSTIKEQFTAAGQADTVVWDSQRSNTFADGGLHKIQIFYMERGAGASNLKIRLNLPTIPDGSLLVRKDVENYFDGQMSNLEYVMKVTQNSSPLADQPYYIYPDSDQMLSTGDDGTFKLKHDQTAVFEGIQGGAVIQIQETDVLPEDAHRLDGGYDILYEAKDSNGNPVTGSNQLSVTMPAAGSVSVTVTNRAKFTKPLTVTKTFAGTANNAAPEGFDADFQLYELNTDGSTWTAVGDPVPYSEFTDGSYTFMLEPDKTYAVIEEIRDEGSETNGAGYTGTSVTTDDEGQVTVAAPDGIGKAVWLADSSEETGDTITFNNIYGVPVGDLSITKDVTVNGSPDNSGDKEFTFTVKLPIEYYKADAEPYTVVYERDTELKHSAKLALTGFEDLNGNEVTGQPEVGQGYAVGTIKLYAGETATIKGLPVNAKINVEEEEFNGYAPSWSLTDPDTDADATINHGETAQATVNAETEAAEIAHIYFTNTTGAALPSTGGVGTQIFTLMGTMMMLGAGVLLMLQRRRREGADAD